MTSNTIEIKVLENPGENWELLLEGFLEYRKRDAVSSGIAALHTTDGQKIMAETLKQMVTTINGPVIIAWDSEKQKVVGDLKTRLIDREIFNLPGGEQPGHYRFMLEKWDDVTSRELQNIPEFYELQSKEANILNRYPELDRYAMVYSCGVLEAYSKQNIGTLLMEKALCELRQLDIKLVSGDFSSVYSQKIATKFGFETIMSMKYEGNYLNFHKTPEHIRETHSENLFMVKKL